MSIEHSSSLDPAERRHEAMMDGWGISSNLANRLQDPTGASFEGSHELPSTRVPHHEPHSIGNVRGFNDGELRDSERIQSDQPLSREQQLKNLFGVDTAEKVLADGLLQQIVSDVEQRIPIDPDNVAKSYEERSRLINALLRKHFDQKHARHLGRAARINELST